MPSLTVSSALATFVLSILAGGGWSIGGWLVGRALR